MLMLAFGLSSLHISKLWFQLSFSILFMPFDIMAENPFTCYAISISAMLLMLSFFVSYHEF
jgi:hypothetical protein